MSLIVPHSWHSHDSSTFIWTTFSHCQGCACVCGRGCNEASVCSHVVTQRRSFPSVDFYFSLTTVPEFLERSPSQMTFPLSIDLRIFYWMKPTETHRPQLHASMTVSSARLIQANLWDQTLLLQSCSHWTTSTHWTKCTNQDVGQIFGCCRVAITVHFSACLAIARYSIPQYLIYCCYIWSCPHRGFTNLYIFNVILLIPKLLLTVWYRLRFNLSLDSTSSVDLDQCA